jgi:hypothetical protein
MFLYIYIYIYTYTQTHREVRSSNLPRTAFFCSYGGMIAPKTHVCFAALARPQRQVHVTFYLYIYTHTQRDRSECSSTTHCPLSAFTAKRSNYHVEVFRCTCAPITARSCYFIYIYTYTNTHSHTYKYIHTHTQTGQQVHLPPTATCPQLLRNDCK